MDKNKKIIIIILLIIIVATIIGYLYINTNSIQVGDASFELPDGYKHIEDDNPNSTNITNNKNTIIIRFYGTNDIDNITQSYIHNNDIHNISIAMHTSNINGITVYKSSMASNPSIIHYWFLYNNKVFEICTLTANSDTESIMDSLIESIH